MKSNILLACMAYILLFTNGLYAQQHSGCGFDAGHQSMLRTNTAYKTAVEQLESRVRLYSQTNANQRVIGGTVYVMPVVVHVVHTGDAHGTKYNPSDLQIQNAINYLNSVFGGTAPERNGEGVGDVNIRFELAKRDPDCNPTNGINHVNGSSLSGYATSGIRLNGPSGVTDLTLKNFIRWDPSKYCNIWVVNKIDGVDGEFGGGTGGYAYFPFNPTVDGIVIRAYEMESGNTTLAHEMGHVFALHHPFYDDVHLNAGNVCPTNNNPATDGDKVTDTDPVTVANFVPDRTGSVNPCMAPSGALYKIETEHNIMNYVLDPRLFTAGQKTRMLASAADIYRLAQINSLGDIDPGEGAITCLPKVNFEWSEFQVTESTTSSIVIDGCTRGYTDYTFKMVIGAAPTAITTATLNASGATEGVDYDITTNGNFITPSKVVTFPSGSTGTQSFTIRVYNDAIVDGTETLTLGFTLNNGGGNAVAGTGRPNLVLTIIDSDKAPSASFVTNATLTSATTGGSYTPFTGKTYLTQRTQALYKASELLAMGVKPGPISKISFDIIKLGSTSFVYNNFTIRMGQTSATYLFNTTNSTGNILAAGSLTTVYSGNYITLNGTNTFDLTQPFIWDGVSSIVVGICYSNSSADTSDDILTLYADDNATNLRSFLVGNGASGTSGVCNDAWSTFFTNSMKPVINFTYTDPGSSIGTIVNTSRSEYLGPFAEVYFYDASTNQLMARVKNLTGHNYGCTEVVIDRAGTGAVAFQSANTQQFLMDKTFRVLPTNNNSAGEYEITLYYTQAEVQGWESQTSQLFQNIQLVKVPDQIKNASPANPSGAGSAVQVDPVRGTLGTNFSLTYTFNTGFSGFGAGIASVVLPVKLLSLTARKSGGEIVLTWTSSSEINTKYFEIERSYDGASFEKIGSVPSNGNSTINSNYEWIDATNTSELSYYRLKMVDQDGRLEYSKVVRLDGSLLNPLFTVVNPVLDQLELSFEQTDPGTADIRLLNASGQVVLRWNKYITPGQRLILPLNTNLPQGVYSVQVIKENQQFIRKVIKK